MCEKESSELSGARGFRKGICLGSSVLLCAFHYCYMHFTIVLCSSLLLCAVHYCCVQLTIALCFFNIFLFWCYTQFVYKLGHSSWNLKCPSQLSQEHPFLEADTSSCVSHPYGSLVGWTSLSGSQYLDGAGSAERSRGFHPCSGFWVSLRAGEQIEFTILLIFFIWGLNY